MSEIIYIASDKPIKPKRNPHEKWISVNEALKLGIKDIPEYMLGDDFDKNDPSSILWSDREINFDIDKGEIFDGDFDDDFSVWVPNDPYMLQDIITDKKYCAFPEWVKFTKGRAAKLLEYLTELMETHDEIELWHIWMDWDEYRKTVKKTFHINELTAEKLEEFTRLNVITDPLTDYCYKILK